MCLILILAATVISLRPPHSKQSKKTVAAESIPQLPSPAADAHSSTARHTASLNVDSHSDKEEAPPHFENIEVHYRYETNDQNLAEITAICVPQEAEDWDQACEQVATYYARKRDWANAGQFADKMCAAGHLEGCILLAKIRLKDRGSDEDAYMQIQRGCDTEEGHAPTEFTTDMGVFIRTDRMLCQELRKHSDPEQGWEAILRMDIWGRNHSLETYFREDF